MDNLGNRLPESDESCLLLIQRNGVITKAGCPFQVVCNSGTGELTEGGVFTVTEVIGTDEDNILFVIDGLPYPHSIFLLFHGLFPYEDFYPNYGLPF